MSNEQVVDPENLWKNFLLECKDYFGCEPKNFLGSAEKYKELFDKAVEKSSCGTYG